MGYGMDEPIEEELRVELSDLDLKVCDFFGFDDDDWRELSDSEKTEKRWIYRRMKK